MGSNKEMTSHPPLPLGSMKELVGDSHPQDPSCTVTHTNKESQQSVMTSSMYAQPHMIQSGNQIIIHVCDESKKRNQDFKCDRNILINNMKYFEKYLCDNKNIEDIDISVHCDINIFDWLMRYIHKKDPKLEIKNSISILISSDFL